MAFVVDCYSRAIVGWHAATVKDTAMVTSALKMALWRRDHANRSVASGLIHHSDAGSQYTSIAFAETLVLKGIAASIGSIGDAYDNALAETTIGLYKTEAVGRNSPFLTGPLKTIDDVEYATMEWVDWYNARRLTACWITSRRTSTRAPITLNPRRPSRRRLNNEAGIQPETVQTNGR